jgi:hypothetical protein
MAPDEGSTEILTGSFCEKAAVYATKSGVDLAPDEVREILGGIAGFYLDAFIKASQVEIRTTTRRAFISDSFAPETQVLTEIKNLPNKPLRFKPFGRLEVVDLDISG